MVTKQLIGTSALLAILISATFAWGQERPSPSHQGMPRTSVRTLPTGAESITASMIDLATFQAKANADLAAELSELTNVPAITFTMFMEEVERSNLDYAAARTSLPIARAGYIAARVYPDPVFSSGYGGDVSNNRQPTAITGGIAESIQLANKVGTRRDVAREAELVASAQLSDFLRNLRAQAAEVFVHGLEDLLMLERKQKHLNQAKELLQTNIDQQRRGSIGEGAVLRSRVNELQARQELTTARSDLQQTLRQMAVFMGKSGEGKVFRPKGTLDAAPRTFSLDALVERAVSARPDVEAARHTLSEARAAYAHIKAERIPDVTVGGNYAHLTRGTNPIDPSPAWDAAYLTLSIPIPISNLNTGPVEAAYYVQVQSEQLLQAAELRAEAEVRAAYDRYSMAVITSEQYAAELLHDTDDIYRAKLYGLSNKKSSLLEVLDAHFAVNEVFLGYYAALGEEARALIALDQAAGIWDIDF